MAEEPPLPGQMMMMLGQLVESTRTLGRDIQEMKQQQVANATRAEKDRDVLKTEIAHVGVRIDGVEDQLATVISKQKSISETQDSMKKVTDQVTTWRLMGIGALGVTSLLFTILGWLLSKYGDRIF